MKAVVQALLVSTALASAGPAFAAAAEPTQVEDVIVTATKMGATRLQDTPLAVTALTSSALESTGIKDVRDLASLVPNLLVTQNASFSQVYIRGIGSNNVFAGSDPSSTIHLDGVYLARPASYLTNFLDVERIEVLRGPQGTLYGRNSVGGTINVISRTPGNTVEGKAQVTVGNYNLRRGEAYISGPIVTDKVAGSLSVLATRRDGYLKNVLPGVGDADDENTQGVRGQLRFTPDPVLDITLRADYMHSDDALAGYVKVLQATTDPIANSILGDYFKIDTNIRSASRRTQQGVAAEINVDLSEGMKLKSLTSYRENVLRQVGDTDGTALNVRRTDQYENQHQVSQEFNLTGKAQALSYILGGYVFQEKINVFSTVTTFPSVAASFGPTVNTSAMAGFGQGTYALTDKLSFTAGVRYTHERKAFDQYAINTNPQTGATLATYPRRYSLIGRYNAWTPKFDIEYRAMEHVLLYVSATKGFKSGGFNFSSVNTTQGFAPETLWSYEGGAKVDLFRQALRVNASVFHYDYKNLQVQSFLSPGVVDITNAANATVDGVELEVQARPSDKIQLGGNVAYLDAQYKDYTNALKAGNIPFNASGNKLNLAPEWAYTVYAQVNVPLGAGSGFVRAEYNYRTRQYFTAANSGLDTQAAYGLVNASVGYNLPGDHIQLLLFGRNLANKQYITSTATFTAGVAGRVGEPRTYGLRAIYKY
jgi:iron complex outermembrane receptor protein